MVSIYCIDGNIGAGKSSVLTELKRRGYHVYQENLSSWGWCLTEYYKNPHRWSFTLQMAVLQSMAEQYTSIVNGNVPIVFIERSPEAGLLFTRNSFRNGTLTINELELCEKLYSMFRWERHITIKLNTPIEQCFERIHRRGRECERDMTIEYISRLDEDYSKFDAIQLDGLQSPEQLADAIESILKSRKL